MLTTLRRPHRNGIGCTHGIAGKTNAPTMGEKGETMSPIEQAEANAREAIKEVPAPKEAAPKGKSTKTTTKGKSTKEAAPTKKAPKGYIEVTGDAIVVGARVFNLGGAAKNGSVPKEATIEVVEKITKAAPGHNGQEYKKLHLVSTKGPKVKRTKFLSMGRKVMVKLPS